MSRYDAVFILNERKFEDGGQAYADKIKGLIEELGGGNVEVKSYGRQRFATTIQKKSSGIYLRFYFDMDPSQVAPFQEKFRLEDSVIRNVVFKYEIPADPRTISFEA